MFALTHEDAYRLMTEWLTKNEPAIAARGMEISVPESLFADLWPEWPSDVSSAA